MNKYHQHIKNLCRRHSITLCTGKDYNLYINVNAYQLSFIDIITTGNPTPAFSIVEERFIAVPCINTNHSYFNALHEVGHIIGDEKTKGEINQVMSAFNLGKVTQYVLKCEHNASSLACKLNKYATAAYFCKISSRNQLAYIAKYESDWKTKLKPPFRFHYLSFSKNKST